MLLSDICRQQEECPDDFPTGQWQDMAALALVAPAELEPSSEAAGDMFDGSPISIHVRRKLTRAAFERRKKYPGYRAPRFRELISYKPTIIALCADEYGDAFSDADNSLPPSPSPTVFVARAFLLDLE